MHAWADEADVWLRLGWAVEMLPDDYGQASKQCCGRLIGLSNFPITGPAPSGEVRASDKLSLEVRPSHELQLA